MSPLAVLGILGVGLGGVAIATSTSKSSKKDDVDNPPRGRVWSEPTNVTAAVEARGWYMDVISGTAQNDRPCGFKGGALTDPPGYLYDDCGGSCFRCKERNGEATPVPESFRVDFGKLDGPRIVAADVRIVDVEGIVARTEPRTRKDSSGRKRGWLDVNEYTLQGAARETVYCERLARKIDGATLGAYLTRRKLPCIDLPATPVQPYTLYRALRDTTKDLATWETWEWFAKVKNDAPADATRSPIGGKGSYRGLYDLRLEVDETGVFVAGRVAPSLAPQQLRVEIAWRTRPV